MAIKRKVREQETALKIEMMNRPRIEDRLSILPESLQVHILSFLDTKYAVQTSTLSTTRYSVWNRIPVLEFNSCKFNKLRKFDEFVDEVLSHRDHSEKLERLRFNRSGISSAKILKKVIDYAFKVGVKQLEVSINDHGRSKTWPISPLCSFDSLKSLKLELESDISNMSFPDMGGVSRSFKNLTVLHLKRTIITDPDPFSGFPVLESLTLINCHRKSLNIHALRLSHLTISSDKRINCCYLTTPKLKFLDYRGADFPLLQTHEGFYRGINYNKRV